MSTYDWLLFLHVLSAFAMIAGYVVFTGAIAAGRNIDRAEDATVLFRVVRPANWLAGIGTVGTIVLGIWLALYLDAYEIWDGWILASLVLWAVATETGRREDLAYRRAREFARTLVAEGRTDSSTELRDLLRTRQGLLMHVLGSVAVLAILALMIFKPGAP